VPRPLTPAGPSPGTLQSASARSQLAEQNDLYGKAIAFRESGDYATAIATFEKLAAKYPSSPLAENAVAERMKLLATMGSGRAAEAARDYIVRYPSGFARADAETILSRGGSDR
jgi:TolA-binding protein